MLKDNIRWLNNISLESETMAHLVSELLLIAQADNKKVIMKKEVFDLSALCAESGVWAVRVHNVAASASAVAVGQLWREAACR